MYYRVHIQDNGWLDWACNGASAGSETYGKRLEGIEIKLIKKVTKYLKTRKIHLFILDIFITQHMYKTMGGYLILEMEKQVGHQDNQKNRSIKGFIM